MQVNHYVEVSKTKQAWSLCVKASELCYSLDYHQMGDVPNSSDQNGERRYNQQIFWSVYVLNKMLSLSVGRPSTMPDWDICTPEPGVPSDADPASPPPLLAPMVKVSRFYGLLYEKFYSQSATRQPDHVKLSRCYETAVELERFGQYLKELMASFSLLLFGTVWF